MNHPVADAIPQVLDRYEMKFLISHDLIEPISRFCEIYCRLDSHSALAIDEFYTVNTIYLDSPRLTLLENKLQRLPERFTLRMRYYGAHPKALFCEVKQKFPHTMRKFRSTIMRDRHDHLHTAEEFHHKKEWQSYVLYERLKASHAAEPVIATNYERKAYISRVDDYARVTFDRGLRACRTECGEPFISPETQSPYDHSPLFGDQNGVVLELKCSVSHVPLWILDLIARFDLKRSGFSKYANSMRSCHGMAFPGRFGR